MQYHGERCQLPHSTFELTRRSVTQGPPGLYPDTVNDGCYLHHGPLALTTALGQESNPQQNGLLSPCALPIELPAPE